MLAAATARATKKPEQQHAGHEGQGPSDHRTQTAAGLEATALVIVPSPPTAPQAAKTTAASTMRSAGTGPAKDRESALAAPPLAPVPEDAAKTGASGAQGHNVPTSLAPPDRPGPHEGLDKPLPPQGPAPGNDLQVGVPPGAAAQTDQTDHVPSKASSQMGLPTAQRATAGAGALAARAESTAAHAGQRLVANQKAGQPAGVGPARQTSYPAPPQAPAEAKGTALASTGARGARNGENTTINRPQTGDVAAQGADVQAGAHQSGNLRTAAVSRTATGADQHGARRATPAEADASAAATTSKTGPKSAMLAGTAKEAPVELTGQHLSPPDKPAPGQSQAEPPPAKATPPDRASAQTKNSVTHDASQSAGMADSYASSGSAPPATSTAATLTGPTASPSTTSPPTSTQVSEAVLGRLATVPTPSRGLDGTWTVTVRLDPPELGQVQATVSYGASGLDIVLVPSTTQGQQVLQQASHQIAANIGSNATVSVHPGTAGSNGGGGRQALPYRPARGPARYEEEQAEIPHVADQATQKSGTYILV